MAEGVMTVREAASRLGVSGQRVRQLISAGTIGARRSSAGWLIDAASVERRVARTGRPASPRTSWAALRLLSSAVAAASQAGVLAVEDGADAEGLAGEPVREGFGFLFDPSAAVADRRLRHHALRLLSDLRDPAADADRWSALLRSRAAVARMWAHPGVIQSLVADPLVSAGGTQAALAIGETLSHTARYDLYVNEADVQRLAERYRLRADAEGQIVLHIVPASLSRDMAPIGGERVPPAAAAADLLEEEDPRARRAALHQLSFMRDALLHVRPARELAVADDAGRHGSQESR